MVNFLFHPNFTTLNPSYLAEAKRQSTFSQLAIIESPLEFCVVLFSPSYKTILIMLHLPLAMGYTIFIARVHCVYAFVIMRRTE